MLRIGQFTDTFLPVVDGVGRVVKAYADTLCKMGHQITVVAPMYDTGYRGGYPFELVDYSGMNVPGMRQYKTGEAPLDAHYRQRMRMIPLDVVHAHSPFTAGSEALRLATLRKLPLVATFHSKYYDDFLKTTHSKSIAKMGVKFVVNFYNRCDEVWAVSGNAGDVLKEYGYTGDVQVLPNGVENRQVTQEDIDGVAARWQLGEEPVILFVGQMDWKKNILTILESCALLKKQGQPFRLVLAGQGVDKEAIEQKIAALGLENEAITVGHISDNRVLDALYARADIFAFPSLYDTSSMVAREAAVMGTPTVMVRGCTACETIDEGVNGYFCENDPEDLARVIKDALADPEALKQMGERAQETIPVPWEKIMEMAVERYERLIALGKEGKLTKKYLRVI